MHLRFLVSRIYSTTFRSVLVVVLPMVFASRRKNLLLAAKSKKEENGLKRADAKVLKKKGAFKRNYGCDGRRPCIR